MKKSITYKNIAYILILSLLANMATWAQGIPQRQVSACQMLAPKSSLGQLGTGLLKQLPKPISAAIKQKIHQTKHLYKKHIDAAINKARQKTRPKQRKARNPLSLDQRLAQLFPDQAQTIDLILALKSGKTGTLGMLDVPKQTIELQAEFPEQALVEDMANAQDATLRRFFPDADLQLGRWAVGALQKYAQLMTEDDLIILQSKSVHSKGCIFVFFKQQDTVYYRYTTAQNLNQGTQVTLCTPFTGKEILKRAHYLRSSFMINDKSQLLLTIKKHTRAINIPKNFHLLDTQETASIPEDIPPVHVRLNHAGYQVSDSGCGMSTPDVLEFYLKQRKGTNTVSQQPDEELDRQTRCFYTPKARFDGSVSVCISGRKAFSFVPKGQKVARQAYVELPHCASTLESWDQVACDKVAIRSMKHLIDKLTDPQREVVGRFPLINSIAALIRYWQPLDGKTPITKDNDLMQYLKDQLNTYRAVGQKPIHGLLTTLAKQGVVFIPNTTAWRIMASRSNIIPLNEELFCFSLRPLLKQEIIEKDLALAEKLDLTGIRIFSTDLTFFPGTDVSISGQEDHYGYLILDRQTIDSLQKCELLRKTLKQYTQPKLAAQPATQKQASTPVSLSKFKKLLLTVSCAIIIVALSIFALS